MGTEIERRFLVSTNQWRDHVESKLHILQGYFNCEELCFRVRVIPTQGAFLTLKTRTSGATRKEWEYPIPEKEGEELLKRSKQVIDKIRHRVPWGDKLWEVDIFVNLDNLMIAEIELESEDESFPLPPWVGREITGESRFSNESLSRSAGAREIIRKMRRHSNMEAFLVVCAHVPEILALVYKNVEAAVAMAKEQFEDVDLTPSELAVLQHATPEALTAAIAAAKAGNVEVRTNMEQCRGIRPGIPHRGI